MVIFALSAWKGSGKDMVADYLVTHHGFKRISFADPLKDRVSEQFNIPRAYFDSIDFKEAPILSLPVNPKDGFSRMIAEFMFKEFRTADGQTPIGFAVFDGKFLGTVKSPAPLKSHNFEPLFWTPRALAILEGSGKRAADSDHWVKQAVSQMQPNGKYVISDVRFQSEIHSLIKSAQDSVVPIRIERFETSPSQDPSERDLDNYPFPYFIDNSGSKTKNQVFDQILSIIKNKSPMVSDEEENNN